MHFRYFLFLISDRYSLTFFHFICFFFFFFFVSHLIRTLVIYQRAKFNTRIKRTRIHVEASHGSIVTVSWCFDKAVDQLACASGQLEGVCVCVCKSR